MEGAEALTKDLLTIRANRDRYYFGINDVLSRHTDIVKQLTENAPALFPPFLFLFRRPQLAIASQSGQPPARELLHQAPAHHARRQSATDDEAVEPSCDLGFFMVRFDHRKLMESGDDFYVEAWRPVGVIGTEYDLLEF